MLETFFQGFLSIFEWPTFGFMLLGIVIAFFVGILPGFGSVAAVAILLPLSYGLDPISAFAFLLAIFAVTETAGDITSVLFGIPGESSTAATVLDGHPMAKRGEAGRALGAVLTSSVMGAILGALFLFLAIPVARPIVLAFGSPEFFMIAILGIALVTSLSGRSVRRGLIMAAAGLILAMVGLDQSTGEQRFTLGQVFLWDGVDLVPVVIGLFAVPELISLGAKGTSISSTHVHEVGGVLEGVKDTFRHWWLTFRCSVLSAFLGMIPGIGQVAQWMTYAHAVQSSKDKSMFGKGDVRGVVSTGAANNSKLGGQLITALAFGIPGSVVTALILGALLIQGIEPGPDMLTDHLDLTASIIWVIVVSNIIALAIALVFLRQLIKITYVPAQLMLPILFLLIFVGAFSANNSVGSIVVMLVFGMVGFALVALNWPRPPLVLGLVLGGLVERYFRISVQAYHGYSWLLNPIVFILLLIIVVSIGRPVVSAFLSARRDRVSGRDAAALTPSDASPEEAAINLTPRLRIVEIVLLATIVVLFGGMLVLAVDFSPRAQLFPILVLAPGLTLAVWALIDTVRGAVTYRPDDDTREMFSRPGAQTAGWVLAFFGAVWLLGFGFGAAAAAAAYLLTSRQRSVVTAAVYAVAGFVVFDILFRQVLGIPFPTGAIFRVFGINPQFDMF